MIEGEEWRKIPPPYPFKKIMIKSKTMRQITKTPFLKRLNKALAVSMRLE
ncbi:hypothetical protein HMPREF1429_00888 [Helicobacter pylori GAM93Bi]|nr:hypothetical protein HMPREF1429_00888 [Helicobacter pylori GAM93Bi]